MTPTFIGEKFCLLTDFRNPYLGLGIHPEWTRQLRTCLDSPKVHQLLESKLEQFAPLVLCYTKIWPDPAEIRNLTGYENPSTCVISSLGEHQVTPWMVIHNMAHSYLSWYVRLKREAAQLLGLDPVHYSIVGQQGRLVHCGSARKHMIPNMAELLYELYTTWVWYGHTQSGVPELAEFCDRQFADIMTKATGRLVWHRYRPPTTASDVDVSGLALVLG